MIRRHVVRFLRREDGPTAVEYAVAVALIVVACLGAVSAVGKSANDKFVQAKNATPPLPNH